MQTMVKSALFAPQLLSIPRSPLATTGRVIFVRFDCAHYTKTKLVLIVGYGHLAGYSTAASFDAFALLVGTFMLTFPLDGIKLRYLHR